jgi:hypothetical protein
LFVESLFSFFASLTKFGKQSVDFHYSKVRKRDLGQGNAFEVWMLPAHMENLNCSKDISVSKTMKPPFSPSYEMSIKITWMTFKRQEETERFQRIIEKFNGHVDTFSCARTDRKRCLSIVIAGLGRSSVAEIAYRT